MSVEADAVTSMDEPTEIHVLRVVGWVSVGMAVAALSYFLGRELRDRYKFKQRTPYDFYSNAGESRASEFGMGV